MTAAARSEKPHRQGQTLSDRQGCLGYLMNGAGKSGLCYVALANYCNSRALLTLHAASQFVLRQSRQLPHHFHQGARAERDVGLSGMIGVG